LRRDVEHSAVGERQALRGRHGQLGFERAPVEVALAGMLGLLVDLAAGRITLLAWNLALGGEVRSVQCKDHPALLL
jgi:hypothetical protein